MTLEVEGVVDGSVHVQLVDAVGRARLVTKRRPYSVRERRSRSQTAIRHGVSGSSLWMTSLTRE